MVVLALFALVALSYARKCFDCDDCANETPVEKKCGSGLNLGSAIDASLKHVCKKVVSKSGKIEKGCERQAVCDLRKTADNAAKQTGTSSMIDKMYCCDGDLCNTGATLHTGVFGLLLAPAVAIIMA